MSCIQQADQRANRPSATADYLYAGEPVSQVEYDAAVIGGGPAGATAGLLLARAGARVIVLEKAVFPRFHIGESLLPRNFPLIRELGLEERLRTLPHVPKFGVEFALGDGSAAASFPFEQGLLPGSETVNIERASFDAMLLDAAREAGAEVRQGAGAKRILQLTDEEVTVEAGGQRITARHLLDASGQATVVARHLGTRQPITDRHLQKIAYFEHFTGVHRPPGRRGGFPLVVMCEEGWFWLIPLDERRTSVGLVLDANVARGLEIPVGGLLRWGIERCPSVYERMREASGPEVNQVAADFSYTCRPYAGSGYFLLGDAAAFIDPIFSTGVTLAMVSAERAARLMLDLLHGRTTPRAAQKNYIRFLSGSTGVFFDLIRHYYDPSFRELFLNGTGPLGVHSAVLSVLAGHVFPRPPWPLRWRLHLFYLLGRLNRHLALVPRRNRFSLLGPVQTSDAFGERSLLDSGAKNPGL